MNLSNAVAAVSKLNKALGLGKVSPKHIPEYGAKLSRKQYCITANSISKCGVSNHNVHMTIARSLAKIGDVDKACADSIKVLMNQHDIPKDKMHELIKISVHRAAIDYSLTTYTGAHAGYISIAVGHLKSYLSDEYL